MAKLQVYDLGDDVVAALREMAEKDRRSLSGMAALYLSHIAKNSQVFVGGRLVGVVDPSEVGMVQAIEAAGYEVVQYEQSEAAV